MAWHLYLLPMIDSGDERFGLVPKYIFELGVTFACSVFGREGTFLCAADLTAGQETTLLGNADVTKIPDNLDQTIGGALGAVQTALEDRNIPAGWVGAGMTYREVIRIIWRIFGFMSRFAAVNQIVVALFNGTTITLNTQFSDLSATNRQRILNAADSFNLDTTGFTGTSTIRQILKGVADQLGSRPFTLQGITV